MEKTKVEGAEEIELTETALASPQVTSTSQLVTTLPSEEENDLEKKNGTNPLTTVYYDDVEDPSSIPVVEKGGEVGEDAEPEVAWCSAGVILMIAMSLLSGATFGFTIAYTPFFLVYHGMSSNCAGLAGKTACESTAFSNCVWLEGASLDAYRALLVATNANTTVSGPTCVFPNYQTVICPSNVTTDECSAVPGCQYSFRKSLCETKNGWTAAESGIFAGFFILGGAIGPLVFPAVYGRVGAKKTMFFMAFIIVIATILNHIGRALESNLPILVLSRVLFGFSGGMGFTIGNTYVQDMAPASKKAALLSVIAFSVPVAIFVFTFGAFFTEPKNFSSQKIGIEERLHGLCAYFWALAIAQVIVGILMPESKLWQKLHSQKVSAAAGELSKEEMAAAEEVRNSSGFNVAFFKENWKQLIVCFVLYLGQQCTGINGIAVFMPVIAQEAMGISPLLAVFVLATFNAAVSPFTPMIQQKIGRPKLIYCGGCFIISFGLMVAGFAVVPGLITSQNASLAILIIGLLIFSLFFNWAVGPGAFAVSVRLFKPEHIDAGMSLATVFLNLLSFVNTTVFPIMIEGISGGPEENQNVGLSATFFILAGTGLFAGFFTWKFCNI